MIKLTNKELQALYKIVKEYEEKFPEDGYNDYYDEYEEIINKRLIKSILKKINHNLPEEIKKEINKIFLRRKYHTFSNEINEEVYSTLKKGLNKKITADIKYFNMEKAEFITRKINVYYTSTKYTIGYCHLRKEIRTFRTSRITSAKLTTSEYNIPEDFNKNDY